MHVEPRGAAAARRCNGILDDRVETHRLGHERLHIPACELDELFDELREMTQLIEELVELARGDVQPLVTEPMRLDTIVEDAVATARRRSAARFDVHLEPSVVAGGRPPGA